MRIISGKLKNRTLKAAGHMRPTSDRVRETLFNMLQNEIPGAHFVDGFAGSGAVGLEALSRGAVQVYFLESNARSLKILEANLALLGEIGNWHVYSVSIPKALEIVQKADPNIDILFFDPPYDYRDYPDLVMRSGQLFPGAMQVLETSTRTTLEIPPEFRLIKERKIGESQLSFLRLHDR